MYKKQKAILIPAFAPNKPMGINPLNLLTSASKITVHETIDIKNEIAKARLTLMYWSISNGRRQDIASERLCVIWLKKMSPLRYLTYKLIR